MGQPQTWRDCGILCFLCLLLFFLGSGNLSVTDPTESNYVLTAKEMLLSGDYLSPRIYGNSWYDKPILFYWQLIAAFAFMGINEAAARFFPAVFASLGVLITYFFAAWLYGRKRGMMTAVILLTSLGYYYLAHAIITDMTLFCSMSLTLVFFYVGYHKRRPRYYYISYVAAAIGSLTKGPIGLVMPGFIILLFLGWQRDFKHLFRMRLGSGIALFFAISSIWYLPMFVLHGWEFIDTFFGVHNVLRATVSEHPEQNVWFYYLLVFFIGFSPWLFPPLVSGIQRLRHGCRWKLPVLETHEKFLWTWAIAVPAVFQCFATKYPTYTLPYMMPIAILFAGYFVKKEQLFYRMALGCIILLPILFYSLAIPLCERNSARQEAEALRVFVDADTCIASYGKAYPASLVFYSGREIPRLETAENIKKLKPEGISWNSLNVMPFLSFEELDENRSVLVVVNKKQEELFLVLAKGEWEMVKEFPGTKLYLRKYH